MESFLLTDRFFCFCLENQFCVSAGEGNRTVDVCRGGCVYVHLRPLCGVGHLAREAHSGVICWWADGIFHVFFYWCIFRWGSK